jgi:hypothetical protein
MKNPAEVIRDVPFYEIEEGASGPHGGAPLSGRRVKRKLISSFKKIPGSANQLGVCSDAPAPWKTAPQLTPVRSQNPQMPPAPTIAEIKELTANGEVTDPEKLSDASTPQQLVDLFAHQFPYRENLKSTPRTLLVTKMEELLTVSSAEELVTLFDWLFIRQDNNVDWQNQMRNWRKPLHVFHTALNNIRHDYGLETGSLKTQEELEDEFLARTYPEVDEWMRPGVHKFRCGVAADPELQRLLKLQEEIRLQREAAQAEYEAGQPERDRAAQVLAEREKTLAEAVNLIGKKRHAYRAAFVSPICALPTPADRLEEARQLSHLQKVSVQIVDQSTLDLKALRDGWDERVKESREGAEAFLNDTIADLRLTLTALGDPSLKDFALAEMPEYEGCVAAVRKLRQDRTGDETTTPE